MPQAIVISVVRQPDGSIRPNSGYKTQVPVGSTVIFRAGGSATRLEVNFFGRSPFGNGADDRRFVSAPGGRVTLANFDADTPSNNVYQYQCMLTVDGVVLMSPPPEAGAAAPEGGEIEIVRFDG